MKQNRSGLVIAVALLSLVIGYTLGGFSATVVEAQPQPGCGGMSVSFPSGGNDIVVTFPPNTSVFVPGSSPFQVTFPSSPGPMQLPAASDLVVTFPSGGAISFPAPAPSGKKIRVDGQGLRVARTGKTGAR